MTPTERAAVAEAIAALEQCRELLNTANDWSVNECRSVLDKSLASLRAVAPAPADQSDAGRDGVIEECAKIAERQEEIERELRMAANKPTADADAAAYHLWAEQSAAIVKRQIRALASAPSETVGRPTTASIPTPDNRTLSQR